jgi:hypothetical protein
VNKVVRISAVARLLAIESRRLMERHKLTFHRNVRDGDRYMAVVTKQRLVSKHFRDNEQLQRCLVSPADHVVPGSQGEHVGLIQAAIITIGAGVIGARDIAAQLYGDSTAKAVLKYKGPPRNIINRAYQHSPDNIVGQMTIDRLDDEMANLERIPPSVLVSVTEAGAPHDHSKCPRLEAGQHLGTPINPLGFGRKINIFGDHETDYLGFEDYATDRDFVSRNEGGPRAVTFDPLAQRGLKAGCASDICMRSSPVTDADFTKRTGKPNTIDEIKRIAMPGCRMTYGGSAFNIASFGNKVLSLGPLLEMVLIPDDLKLQDGTVARGFFTVYVLTIL